MSNFDSEEVCRLKTLLQELRFDWSDWAKRQRKRLQSSIRGQRLSEARLLGTHTDEEWDLILNRFDYRCVACGCHPDPRPCKDHITPIYMGGSDSADNLQPLCRECNTGKGPSTFNWSEFRDAYGFEEDEQ